MKLLKKFDRFLFLFHILVFLLGAFALLSTSETAFKSQILFFSIGLLLYFSLCFVDFSVLKNKMVPILFYLISLLLLISVLKFGESIRGAVRWFNLGIFNFQPSELVKVMEIIVLAYILQPLNSKYLSAKKIILSFIVTLVLVFLINKQPDLGSALVVFGIWAFMVLYGGIKPKYIIAFMLLFSALSYPVWTNLHSYQKDRIISFVNPYSDPLGSGYNVIQSVIAVGSGEVFGRGFGRGTQSHLRFLPEYKTDFIFAAYAEEWGFIGSILIISLYFAILFRLLKILKDVRSDFGSLILIGAFSLLFIQGVVNMGMNLGILPVTGITLPLVSYGGSSLIATCLILGIAQSIAIRRRF